MINTNTPSVPQALIPLADDSGEICFPLHNVTICADLAGEETSINLHFSHLTSVDHTGSDYVSLRFVDRNGRETDVTIFNVTRDQLIDAMIEAPNRFSK